MSLEIDIAIIGAGVVGLAIAAELSERHSGVFVFERNAAYGSETSSRNSEVIHAGIYYPQGSLKAKLCVEGRRLLYESCAKHRIPHRKLGKIIVATSEEEVGQLEAIREKAQKNGVDDLRPLSRAELKTLEPNIEAKAGLLSPSTGIISAHSLMDFFHKKARESGADFIFGAMVIGLEPKGSGYTVRIRDSEGISEFTARVVINAAGLDSDKVAGFAGVDITKAGYRLHYCKGNYASLSPKWRGYVSRLIYPPPEHAGLGVHLTLGLDGRMRLGPNTRYVDAIDYKVDESVEDVFYRSAKKFLPFLEPKDVRPDFAGIRPKLQGPTDDFRDFVITHEEKRGLPCLINLVGIESPGLTASPAIGRMVAEMVAGALS